MDHLELLHAIERRLDERIGSIDDKLDMIQNQLNAHMHEAKEIKEANIRLKSELGAVKWLGASILSLTTLVIGWVISIWPFKS